MKSTKKWTNALWILNVIYLIVLTWLILLKGSVSLPAFGQFRSINLIPLGASLIVNGKLDLGEIWMNILAFIPLGLYTGLLHPRWPVGAWCLTGLEVSLLFEIIQYILGIGATDITDVITNTTGGVLGVLLLLLLRKLLKERTSKILTVIAAAATVAILGLMLLILITNWQTING